MFTTFDISASGSLSDGKPLSPPTSQPRPKRAQVSRACDWCRLTRVKCDSTRPCRNCKQAKRECINSGRDDFKSVAAATKEVQRLRAQVQELENKLLSPSTASGRDDTGRKRLQRWKGVRINGIQYGPSSLAYFSHRLSAFIKTGLEPNPSLKSNLSPPATPSSCDRLQREQQDALLDLYWQGYHAIYPVLEEAAFRRQYDSLWHGNMRQACPLVDIVIALCIQFGSSYTATDALAMPDQPGYNFYLQAQQSLSSNLETPAFMSVQCYFLSAIYLLSFKQTNSAYMMVRLGISAAESLGLQFDDGGDTLISTDVPSTSLGPRLWQCLVILDTQISLDLGRPFATANIQSHGQAEPESDEVAQLAGPNFDHSGSSDINWLRFVYERQRLFQIVREINSKVAAVVEGTLEEIEQVDFYQHPASREKCAKYLYEQLKRLKTWVEELPESLKTPRVQGVPFSVDRSKLNLSQTDPLWLQRQRLVLELDYHSLVIMLTRTFNSFLPTPALGTFNSDNHCITSVNSGIVMTLMLYQILSGSEILAGFFQIVGWQRTAALALAGFACGYPICPLSPVARKTLPQAARVFEMTGSREDAQLVDSLKTKCFDIVQVFCTRLGIATPVTTPADTYKDTENIDESMEPSSYQVMSVGEEALTNAGFDNILNNELWATDSPGGLLWGDLMRDLDSGLASSLGHIGVRDQDSV
ncbi:transcription factor [Fusarium sporotrichioides]|uniref:Transcription factor n=1 Tax=Fusarium sporotrichioides TaxID=5514 RepID=A0A395S9T7_FUSSP|nr:transcription factor [Fusarium sporotrichioides]